MISKLRKSAETSSLMDISIRHKSIGKIKFNLFEELIISEGKINEELKDQPGIYSYLGILHKKLERIAKDKQMQYEKEYSKYYLLHKSKVNTSTGRINDRETAVQMTMSQTEVTAAQSDLIKAEEDRDIIGVCLKSFDQRASMLQTLSANVRRIS